jgi:L-rhamnose isomerase/sugar isomerase
LADSLAEIYAAMDEDQRLLLEYKIFEPYFYTMDLPDWGTSLLHCMALGERAKVILDTGHHAQSTNIEFIVMQLVRQDRLGAFDFNSRYNADDDLIVGSADPFQLFRIMFEIVEARAHRPESGVNFMLDQCHNIEEKIPGQIRSVMNVQAATAKALLVDQDALKAAQQAGDILGAHGVLMDAYETDVRGVLADRRESLGLPRDPLKAFADSGYAAKVAAERVGGVQASWGA